MSILVNVLGHDVKFLEEDCHSYEDMCDALYKNAPAALKDKLITLNKKEMIDLMADIWIEVDIKADN